MPKKRPEQPDAVLKARPGVELGLVLRRLMRNPPYLKPPRTLGFYWVPKALASEIGSSDSAVRQWLRGVALPELFMPRLIAAIFGPDREQFADQLKELQDAFQCGLDIKAGRETGQAAKPKDSSIASIPHLAPHSIGRNRDIDAKDQINADMAEYGSRRAVLESLAWRFGYKDLNVSESEILRFLNDQAVIVSDEKRESEDNREFENTIFAFLETVGLIAKMRSVFESYGAPVGSEALVLNDERAKRFEHEARSAMRLVVTRNFDSGVNNLELICRELGRFDNDAEMMLRVSALKLIAAYSKIAKFVRPFVVPVAEMNGIPIFKLDMA